MFGQTERRPLPDRFSINVFLSLSVERSHIAHIARERTSAASGERMLITRARGFPGIFLRGGERVSFPTSERDAPEPSPDYPPNRSLS